MFPLLLASIAGVDWLHWILRVICIVLWLALPIGAWLNSRHFVTTSNMAAFGLTCAALVLFIGFQLYDATHPYDDGFFPGAGYMLAIILMMVGALTSEPGPE
ncbi:hypothetical protein [Nocardioides terrisoli]|uniref:hypothetical protein n=1 Tax=Nocardioides terrisoli TaxID=3388267 RepID=UPI00287BC1D1|nr:hypothetical protein [Nocardioides marmorisolisilvae]